MAYIKTLKRYSAFLYPNQSKQSGRINLYFEGDKLYIIFYDDPDALPANSYNGAHKVGVAHQPFSKYQHYLDLVRNEKPISVTFRPEDTPPSFVVYCASEPPGEGEI